jgi:integrase
VSAKLERTATPGIYKRGSRYVVTFRDPLGRQRKRSARTLSEARNLKAELTADVRRGEYRAQSKVTFAEYAPEWIRSYAGRTSRGVRDATKDDYRRRLGLDEKGEPLLDKDRNATGAIAFFGRAQLAAIEPRDIKKYAQELAKRGLAPNTVRLHLAPVKALLATAVEEGVIRSNPSAGLRLAVAQQEEADDGHVKALTEEELEKVLAAIPPPHRLFFEFLHETGLRIGEAIALRWADVDLGRRHVQVRRRYYRGTFAPPKSRYGRRDVPISQRLAKELELRWLTEEDVEGLVFPSTVGKVLDASNLMRRVLKPAARTAGVPWVSFHTFRHTCATTLFRRGLNAKTVQVWLGHHSPAFTLAVYVHLLSDDLPDADQVFGDTCEGGNTAASRPAETSRNDDPADEPETRITPARASRAETLFGA